jgi:hypothetical protein
MDGHKSHINQEIENMLRLSRAFIIVLPAFALAGVPAAYPQLPASSRVPARAASQVTVDGTAYNVTPMGGFLRVDTLDGQMIGMGRKDGSIIAPQSGDGFKIVKAAVNEYLHPTNGAAPANNPPPADNGLDARNATPQVPAAANPAAAPASEIIFDFTKAGAVYADPVVRRSVTLSNDGTEARYTTPAQGMIPARIWVATFEGGEEPDGGAKKLGKILKGATVSTLESKNPGAIARISTHGTETWKLYTEDPNTGKRTTIFEGGDFKTGYMVTQGRENGGGAIGKNFFASLENALEAATAEAAKRQAAGEPVPFDPNSDRSQRALAALKRDVQHN